MKKECRFGHMCTSRCGNDIDCPCQSEHCCALTENCEGEEYCDDHYKKITFEEAMKVEDQLNKDAILNLNNELVRLQRQIMQSLSTSLEARDKLGELVKKSNLRGLLTMVKEDVFLREALKYKR